MPSNVVTFPGASHPNLALSLAELEQRVNTLFGIVADQTGQITTLEARFDALRAEYERLRANSPAPALQQGSGTFYVRDDGHIWVQADPQHSHESPPCSFCLERCSFCAGPDQPLRP